MNETGIAGQLTPYLLSNDEWVTAILIGCFLITACVLSQGKTLLFQSLRKLFSSHGIGHLFHKQTNTDTCFLLLLNLQTCLLVAVLWLKYVVSSGVGFTESKALYLLSSYVLILILYLLGKRCIYKVVNWVFFDKAKNSLWLDSYFFTISILGMLLLPVTLLVVFCNFPLYVSVIIPAFLFFLADLFFIYKCFSIFFNQLHGSFYLFLYFCTLEILPLLVVWKGTEMINDMLI